MEDAEVTEMGLRKGDLRDRYGEGGGRGNGVTPGLQTRRGAGSKQWRLATQRLKFQPKVNKGKEEESPTPSAVWSGLIFNLGREAECRGRADSDPFGPALAGEDVHGACAQGLPSPMMLWGWHRGALTFMATILQFCRFRAQAHHPLCL